MSNAGPEEKYFIPLSFALTGNKSSVNILPHFPDAATDWADVPFPIDGFASMVGIKGVQTYILILNKSTLLGVPPNSALPHCQ